MPPRSTRGEGAEDLTRKPSRNRLLAAAGGLVALLALCPNPATAATYRHELRRYPYLTDVVNDGTTGYATINWATDRSATTGSARYGVVGADGSCAPLISVAATKTSITVNSVSEYQWKAKLTLSPDTQYCYRVFLGSLDLLGSDTTPAFRTQVQGEPAEGFKFAVLGDWGQVDSTGANPDQANVLRRIATSGARFAVTTGDNTHPNSGQPQYGDLWQTGANTSAIFGPSFWKVPGASVPIFPTLGNHGMATAATHFLNWPQDRAVATSGGTYRNETYCCVNGTSSATYGSAWYAFDAANARFYVLQAAWADTNFGSGSRYKNDYDTHWTPTSAEYQWLQNDLAAHASQLKFAFFHFPLYSDNATEVSDNFLRGAGSLEGLLGQNGVVIAFNGHAHTYQRNRKPPGGVISYVTGGGGAKLQPIGPCTATDAYGIGWSNSSSKGSACGGAAKPATIDRVFHFLLVTVDGTTVTVTPIDELGRSFDQRTWDFSDTEPPSPPGDLSASAQGGNQVDLSWTASTDNDEVDGYRVHRRLAGATTWVQVATTQATSYSDRTVAPATSYEYQVTAFDAAENSSVASNTATVTTPPVFGATADARVEEATPDSNFGTSSRLYVDTSPNRKSYLRFTVSGVSGTVQSAKLRLYVSNGSVNGPAVYGTSTGWTETGITWANRPPPSTGSFDDKGAVTVNTWIELDVTPIVTGNGIYSFLVDPNSSDGVDFHSKEASSNRPQLVLTLG